MVELVKNGAYLLAGRQLVAAEGQTAESLAKAAQEAGVQVAGEQLAKEAARQNTIASGIIKSHDIGGKEGLSLKFDALTSHDITFVGIIQTAMASG